MPDGAHAGPRAGADPHDTAGAWISVRARVRAAPRARVSRGEPYAEGGDVRGGLRQRADERVHDAGRRMYRARCDLRRGKGLQVSIPIRIVRSEPAIVGIPLRRGAQRHVGSAAVGRSVFPASVVARWPDGSARVVHVHAAALPLGAHEVSLREPAMVAAKSPAAVRAVATMPAAYLCNAGLFPGLVPSSSTFVPAADLDKAPTTMPDPALYDAAQLGFARTFVDADPEAAEANQVRAYASAEPWLYDRASSLFQLYARTGSAEWLAHAIGESVFYRDNLYRLGDTAPDWVGVVPRNVGMFRLKVRRGQEWPGGNGAMYSYALPLLLRWWLLGDAEARDRIADVMNAHASSEGPKPAGEKTWNERHVAVSIMSACAAWEAEIGGDREASRWNDLDVALDDLHAARTPDGPIWHTYEQHGEGDGKFPGRLVASPWMASLLVHALARIDFVRPDPRARATMLGFARFLARSCTWRDGYGGRHLAPPYLVSPAGPIVEQFDDAEHAIDVASAILVGAQAAPDASALRSVAADLLKTHRRVIHEWIRPNADDGRADYRVTPPRKFSWQYGWGTPSWISHAASSPSPAEPIPVEWSPLLPATAKGSSVVLDGDAAHVVSTGWKVGVELREERSIPAGATIRASALRLVTSTPPADGRPIAPPIVSLEVRWVGETRTKAGSAPSGARATVEVTAPGREARADVIVRVLSNDARRHSYTASGARIEVIP